MHPRYVRVSINRILIVLYIIYVTIPAVAVYLPSSLRIAIKLFIIVFGYGAALLGKSSSGNRYVQMTALIIPLYCLLAYFSMYSNLDFVSRYTDMLLAFLPPFLLVYCESEQSLWREKILKLCMVLFVLTAITTIIGLLTNPEASRLLAATINYDERLAKSNIGGYETIYALVMLIPLTLITYKVSFWTVVFSAIEGICIVMSQYSIAILLLVVGLLFVIIKPKKPLAFFIFITIVIVALSMTNLPLKITDELIRITSEWGLLSVEEKLRTFALYMRSNVLEGGLNARIERYSTSIEMFMHNPIFGRGFSRSQIVGGHSTVLDVLGAMGLVGFFISLYVFIRMFRTCGIRKGEMGNGRDWILIILFVLLAIMNPILTNAPMTLVVFFMYPLVIQNRNEGMLNRSVS